MLNEEIEVIKPSYDDGLVLMDAKALKLSPSKYENISGAYDRVKTEPLEVESPVVSETIDTPLTIEPISSIQEENSYEYEQPRLYNNGDSYVIPGVELPSYEKEKEVSVKPDLNISISNNLYKNAKMKVDKYFSEYENRKNDGSSFSTVMAAVDDYEKKHKDAIEEFEMNITQAQNNDEVSSQEYQKLMAELEEQKKRATDGRNHEHSIYTEQVNVARAGINEENKKYEEIVIKTVSLIESALKNDAKKEQAANDKAEADAFDGKLGELVGSTLGVEEPPRRVKSVMSRSEKTPSFSLTDSDVIAFDYDDAVEKLRRAA